MNWRSVMTAVVSPFRAGKLDLESFDRLLAQQAAAGIEHIVINGTTGESPCLRRQEVVELFNLARRNHSALNLVLGVGGNATDKLCEELRYWQSFAIDGVLSVVPYYNKPSQEGLKRHFQQLADVSPAPLLLYNVPGRTITSLAPDTVAQLAQHPHIVGIKEASGKPELFAQYRELCGENFVLLSGDDATYLESIEKSCDGVISVFSNVFPQEFINWSQTMRSHRDQNLQEFSRYRAFCDLLFVETNPVPVKECLYQMGILASPEPRLPLVSCSTGLAAQLRQELVRLGVLA